MFNSVVQWGKTSGEPLTWQGQTLRAQTRSLRIHLPCGALVWNWPEAVSVQTGDAEPQTLAVRDTTRIGQIAIFGCALVCVGLIGIAVRGRAAHSVSLQEMT